MAEPTLYIVPTPIGNLRDITLRALDILKQVDLIACEDTRHTLKLLSHFGISKRLVSYEKFSEVKRAAYLIEQLESGKSIALVSDAGTPMVSDPGCVMIAKVRDRGIRIEALPGPSAIIAAQSASGFDGPFRFIGFFPRNKGSIKLELSRIKVSRENTIFFESPRRIEKTLASINEVLADRVICLAREISKIHEEYIVGPALEV
ncbi:MAG: 16S rRNA (cytidine(1402)-2'-O)-methyltransferase, partial [Deltaproteobacteria bacterium]|nr:16S rRNA (cytidine(1402)-2'-O)-methyltransferase [Deltaproteobacteria bacterium]